MRRTILPKPSYLELPPEELRRRSEQAWELMASPCRVCPRHCKVDRRQDDKRGFCRVGVRALVSSFSPHFGEEPPLVGVGGSGTIFLSSCRRSTLQCLGQTRQGLAISSQACSLRWRSSWGESSR